MSSDLRDSIRSIPDYPKPGIMFRDITTLLGDARAFCRALDDAIMTAPDMRDAALVEKLRVVARRVLG